MQEIERGIESIKSMLGLDSDSNVEHSAIELLKKDHRKVEKLFQEFKAASKKSEKKQIAQKICQELQLHTQVEEELVYPLIAKVDEDEAEESYSEHSVIKFMIQDVLPVKASDAVLEPRVKVLEELVKHHVLEEETKTLPELKETSVDLDELGSRIAERKAQLNHVGPKRRRNTTKAKVARKSATRSHSKKVSKTTVRAGRTRKSTKSSKRR